MVSAFNTALKISHESEGEKVSDIISVPEACRFLAIHRNTLYKLIQAKELPAFRMMTGGRWKFRKSELIRWLEDKETRSML